MAPEIALRPYASEDFALLVAVLGDPAMMTYMGGPDSIEVLREHHTQYVEESIRADGDQMFVIEADGEAAGTSGYWQREHDGLMVWETGVSVLTAFQGRGIATRALAATIELARGTGKCAYAYAYPMVEHHVSNALCRRVGYELEGEGEFEYPSGTVIRCNMWRFQLT